MQQGLKLRNYKITKSQNPQRGYMLITLMLALALITIGLLTVLPEIGQQIRRDREEEMRHRGTGYMRAIQHFYKKFGRYPMRVEELENTNNLRFLRKRYKDPINRDPATGQERDFKLLHQTDISLNNGPVLGQIPGQGLPGQGQGGLQGPGGFGGAPGGLGGPQGGLGGLGAQASGLQSTSNSGAQTSAGGDADNPSSGNASDAGGNSNSAGSSSSSSNPSSNSGSGFNGPTFGGGPILGVASTSKEKSIRVFYEKNHYKDWLFIYVPQADRGGLLTGPVSLNGPTGNFGGAPGQPVSPGPGFTPITGAPGAQAQPAQNPGQTPPPEQ